MGTANVFWSPLCFIIFIHSKTQTRPKPEDWPSCEALAATADQTPDEHPEPLRGHGCCLRTCWCWSGRSAWSSFSLCDPVLSSSPLQCCSQREITPWNYAERHNIYIHIYIKQSICYQKDGKQNTHNDNDRVHSDFQGQNSRLFPDQAEKVHFKIKPRLVLNTSVLLKTYVCVY